MKMFLLFLFVALYPCILGSDLGDDLVPILRDVANLDLPADDEYEDLRSEFLTYRSLLDYMKESRRSLITTPCLQTGGICINVNLCPGFRQLTESPGCRSHKKVCCFVWNIFNVRDHRDQGIRSVAYPWRTSYVSYGGKGVEVISKETTKKKKKKRPTKATIPVYEDE